MAQLPATDLDAGDTRSRTCSWCCTGATCTPVIPAPTRGRALVRLQDQFDTGQLTLGPDRSDTSHQ